MENNSNPEFEAFIDQVRIAVPDNINDPVERLSFAENQRRLIKSDFLSRYTLREVNGKQYYFIGDERLISIKDGSPLTAQDIMNSNYKGMVLPGEGFSCRRDVHAFLISKGFDPRTKKYGDELYRIIKEYQVEKY